MQQIKKTNLIQGYRWHWTSSTQCSIQNAHLAD